MVEQEPREYDYVLEDHEPPAKEDLMCPTILLLHKKNECSENLGSIH